MLSSTRSSYYWPAITAVIAILAIIIALPDSWKPWAPAWLKPSAHLGIDLAGGTQLDFRISEKEILEREQQVQKDIDQLKNQGGGGTIILAKQQELAALKQQHAQLVEAIRGVLERRINSLGVSEATITPSYYGNEKHLLVECPGVIDVSKCIQTVGKTIQLEFKEEFSGPSADFEKDVRAQADKLYQSIVSGSGTLQSAGQDLSSKPEVAYIESRSYFLSELNGGLEKMWNRTVSDPVLEVEGSTKVMSQNAQGTAQFTDIKGIYLAKVLKNRTASGRVLADASQALEFLSKQPDMALTARQSVPVNEQQTEIQQPLSSMQIGEMQAVALSKDSAGVLYLSGRIDGTQEMQASHILVSYKGADRSEATVTRTKDEAKKRALELLTRLQKGEGFTALAKAESDGPSKEKGGSLGTVKAGMLYPSFEQAAFALKAKGQLSAVVESPAGFHIIRADVPAYTTPASVSYSLLALKGANAMAKVQDIIKDIENKKVISKEDAITLRLIFFSLQPTGWKDTNLNGLRFRSASVTVDQLNTPVVQILFDEEGAKIFQQLTKRNIGKRIAIFVGGELVSAPTVNNEISGGSAVITGSRTFEEAQKLAQDLNTGAIPAPIYLSGQSTIEATLGSSALTQSVQAGLVGLLIVAFLMLLIYRGLGLMADIALFLYVAMLIALMKLPILLITNQYVVLSLAGIAGIILSMGMAVDANILVFERIKEEVAKGKLLKTATETGFKRAWPSIRDGNVSTLITSAILFIIGTSIIRGFAVTLVIGVLLSLFTAIVVSGWLVRHLVASIYGQNARLIGVKPPERNE